VIRLAVSWLRVIATFTLLLLVFLFCVSWFLPVAFLKVLLPFPPLQRWCTRYLVWIAGVPWVGGNRLVCRLVHGAPTRRFVEPTLDPQRSWLVVGNHQSWADIVILTNVLFRRAPFPRFFLKRQLLWVPLIGFVCWAMDMPFMKRHSAAAIAADPSLRSEDLNTTRRACQRFRGTPVTVVNYLEGTRFTPSKRKAMSSPYAYLLRPKSAGLTFALHAMGDQFAGIIDLTIAYCPSRHARLWSFLAGEQRDAYVHARLREVPEQLLAGGTGEEAELRGHIKSWVNEIWSEKDAELRSVYESMGEPAMSVAAAPSLAGTGKPTA
jgi:1-acyl-sn-glycerol-3-phosphate acyltransferase